MKKKYNLRNVKEEKENKNKKLKKNIPPPPEDEDSSESDAETIFETDDDSDEREDDEEEEEEDILEKIIKHKKKNKKCKNTEERDDESENENEDSKKKMKESKKTKSNPKTPKKKNSKIYDGDDESEDCESGASDSDSSQKEEDENDEDYEGEDDDDDEKNKVKIFLKFDDIMEDYDDENMIEMTEENENEYNGSDDEKVFMKEKYENIKIENETSESDEEITKNGASNEKKSKKCKLRKKNNNNNNEVVIPNTNIEAEYVKLLSFKKDLIEQLKKSISKQKSKEGKSNKKNTHMTNHAKFLKKTIFECDNTIQKLIKNARKKNTKTYRELVMGKGNKMSEIDFFKKNLSNKEQMNVMNDLQEINKSINIETPYRLLILQSNIPTNFKKIAIQKLNFLRSMQPGDSEYHKVKYWVDNFMKIPFGIQKNLSVSLKEHGLEVCNDFLKNAKNTLDNCVYGLENAKLQIMQLLGQWITNPSSVGTAIAIKGPPGSGKTMLIKEGISKILGREFAFITLGGATDGSYLEGHSYTYEGSTWGKIVQILMECKCMNPIIYFDELDKVSDSSRGQEIIGILTHLIDTTQNNQFHDKYFSEIDFDLSKCLFIFSYNDENLVNPILKDRMYRIQTKEYETKEKIIIARNFLIPKIREQVCFNETEVIIPDETIQYIISNSFLTKNEQGVRNLKRCLEIIYTKLNLYRLIKPDDNDMFFQKQGNVKIEFPMTVLKAHVDFFIKNEENQNQSLFSMYV